MSETAIVAWRSRSTDTRVAVARLLPPSAKKSASFSIGTARISCQARASHPLLPVEEVAVPQGAAPGDFTAPTQPESHGLPDIIGDRLSDRDGWGITPIDQLFPPSQLPGYNQDTQFTRIGAFIDWDRRDSKTGPRSGGVLGMRYREYWDVDRKAFAFRQTEYEFQQYFPYFNRSRVIALRAAMLLTFPKGDNQVPIYLQPVLGGNDDLRGFGGYRFRDNHSVYAGVEHRWQASSNLEMSAFLDAGKVVPLRRDIDVSRMNYSGGIGFRVRVRSAIVSRTDFAVSREGFRIAWTFSDIFQSPW